MSIFRGGLFSEKKKRKIGGLPSPSVSLFKIQTHTNWLPFCSHSSLLSQDRQRHKTLHCGIMHWLCKKKKSLINILNSSCTSGFTDIKKAFIPCAPSKAVIEHCKDTHSWIHRVSQQHHRCLMENMLKRGEVNKDMSCLCANMDTEDISWEKKTMPNRKQAATASFLLPSCLSRFSSRGTRVNTQVLTVNTANCFCRWPEEELVITCKAWT